MRKISGRFGAVAMATALMAMMLAASRVPAQAQTYTVLNTFTGGTDGANPYGLISDPAGNLYGVASGGGAYGQGVVFKLDTAGNETVLYSFTGGTDGAFPYDRLVRDSAGNLYGSTAWGGILSSACNGPGCGVVFRLDPTGSETVIYSFTQGAGGNYPNGGLVLDAAGDLYGTTNAGGRTGGACNTVPPFGCGVVFKLDPAGNETVLHTFVFTDGATPNGDLMLDTAGNLYGTTYSGGTHECQPGSQPYGCGVAFRLDPAGDYTVLYNFTGRSDGAGGNGGLILDAAGNLYGPALYGGSLTGECAPYGCGVVFKLNAAGNETVLYTFSRPTGSGPVGSMIRDAAGNVYGMTTYGGNGTVCGDDCGVIFKLSPAGKETVLHSFTGGKDGFSPLLDGLLAYKGFLYGSTALGGLANGQCSNGCGVVFKVSLH